MVFQAFHTHTEFYVATYKILCGHIENFMWPYTKFYVVKKPENTRVVKLFTT